MIGYISLIFAILSGVCLFCIAIKNKIPLWGGIVSPSIRLKLDKVDRCLAILALLFFLICLVCLALSV